MSDGSVSVMTFITNDHNGLIQDPTPENIQKEIDRTSFLGGITPVSWRIVDEDKIPEDRTFRGAWTDQNPTETIDVDMEKAKEIQRGILRLERSPLLEKLDIEYMKALEAKDEAKMAEITARKQELRDITKLPEIESATTPEELKEAGKELL